MLGAPRTAYDWLTESQLRAALVYAEEYPDEIDERARRSAAWTPETLRRHHPGTVPQRRE